MHAHVDAAVCDEVLKGTKGTGYRGCQSKTISGYTCQNWAGHSDQDHTFEVGNHNYCRNPNNRRTIWCYTTDSTKTRDFCAPLGVCVCACVRVCVCACVFEWTDGRMPLLHS